jgi:hypothetical protein
MVLPWSEPYQQTLAAFATQYSKASGTNNKQQVVNDAVQVVKEVHSGSAELKGKPLPQDLPIVSTTLHRCIQLLRPGQQRVKNWFRNYAPPQRAEAPLHKKGVDDQSGSDQEGQKPRGSNKFTKNYKLRDAVAVIHSNTISQILIDREAGPPGGKKYLAMYPGVLSEVVKGLNRVEKAEAIALSETWNREGAPDELKKK